ncbi:hypothetical protein OJAV_G00007970 [Oryzias javanicus]|uniref:Essential MCU regulator, mitochondrial n=1 Tax=Oryzias javanicus TaxID=123683 RepID=A0A437DNK1_ORYJA|nr:hypothetical protein OJAV_G00007970 [Oryzias javanicus]
MANLLRQALRLASTSIRGTTARHPVLKTSPISRAAQSRTVVSTSSGGILPKPDKTPFGLIRMTAVVVPFLYMTTTMTELSFCHLTRGCFAVCTERKPASIKKMEHL